VAFASTLIRADDLQIRDRIYEELLVIRRDQKDQDEHDYLQKCLKEGAPEWQVQLGFDRMDEDYSLCLDYNPSKGAKSIAPNLGILLTCKQVWEEATDIRTYAQLRQLRKAASVLPTYFISSQYRCRLSEN
jgi:hypothetical protein